MTAFPFAVDPEAIVSEIPEWLKDVGQKALLVALIIVGAIAVNLLLRLLIRRIVRRVVASAKSRANTLDTQAIERSPLADMRLIQRTRTLGSILQNILNVAIFVIAVLLILSTVAEQLLGSLTLLTAAIGASLGFGAQHIVKDILNGLVIVAEDQIGIGDVVDLDLASGVVEHVSVRVTQVRDVNGTLWYVRNGEIARIGNLSQGWARAIVDVGVAPDADVKAVEAALLGAAQELAADPKWQTRILSKPEVWGLEAVTGEALLVRVVLKTRSNVMDDVARELRMRLRAAVAELGVAMPSLESVIPSGINGARRVRGANPPRTFPTDVIPVKNKGRGIWRKHNSPPKESS